MKEYVVYTDNGIATIKAEKIIRVTIDELTNELAKILFKTGDKIVAEFYTDHIIGWIEVEEDSE